MRNTKHDRRSQRTRQLASRALVELMLEKRYDDITVQDIIDRANIGRSTFYAHFLDKEDLLVSDFSRVLDMFSQHGGEGQGNTGAHGPPNVAVFFRHVQEYQQLYKALVRSGQIELLTKKAHQRLRHNIEQHLVQFDASNRSPVVLLSLAASTMASTMVSMLQWWLDNEMPYTPEQMEALFHQLVLPGIQHMLQAPAVGGASRSSEPH